MFFEVTLKVTFILLIFTGLHLVYAQTQEIGMLQVAVSEDDACNQNCKPSTSLLACPQPITFTSTPY